jgi:hypothetical protein
MKKDRRGQSPGGPSTWSAAGSAGPGDPWRTVRPAAPEQTEPTPTLNHETTDHLLSLIEDKGSVNHRDSRNKPCF